MHGDGADRACMEAQEKTASIHPAVAQYTPGSCQAGEQAGYARLTARENQNSSERLCHHTGI